MEGRECSASGICLICKGLFGGPDRDRTDDLFHAMEARSQLRHRPTVAEDATLLFSLRVNDSSMRCGRACKLRLHTTDDQRDAFGKPRIVLQEHLGSGRGCKRIELSVDALVTPSQVILRIRCARRQLRGLLFNHESNRIAIESAEADNRLPQRETR